MSLPTLPPIAFIEAANYTPVVGVPRSIDLIVIHSAETGEHDAVAENIAAGAAKPDAPMASWHYAIDRNSIVQSVRDADVAWHAPGANRNGLGLEHAGRARQTPADWDDAYSRAMLLLSTALSAHLCNRYDIPVRFVNVADLKRGGARGFTDHASVSLAFRKSTHTDPGKGFPWPWYLATVQAHLVGA